jgi:hypothetical protein
MGTFRIGVVGCGILVTFVVSLTLLSPANGAEKAKIFTLADPKGDDHGDGTLLYPKRSDMRPGDLDIVEFAAQAESGGTVFEASFDHHIRLSSRRTVDKAVAGAARLGFYTFNIDVYIDTDRVPGSGSTVTLPGRHADIAAANAWEKAICLTPWPNEAREFLKKIYEERARREAASPEGAVAPADAQRISSSVAQKVASTVYFPTLVWVTGHQIRFFVPDSFLGGPARPNWCYVVAVSGADISDDALNLSKPFPPDEPVPDKLMIIPVGHGMTPDNFWSPRGNKDFEPALIDIIVPADIKQETVLHDYSAAQGRFVQLPGVVPADQEHR